MDMDIRWEQRFSNYKKALAQLEKAVELRKTRELSELEKQGLIQSFEYTHELAWKTLKDFLKSKGQSDIYGSKDATRKAFNLELIQDGDGWMDMIKSRNKTSHTYDETVANEISENIKNCYYPLFLELRAELESKVSGDKE